MGAWVLARIERRPPWVWVLWGVGGLVAMHLLVLLSAPGSLWRAVGVVGRIVLPLVYFGAMLASAWQRGLRRRRLAGFDATRWAAALGSMTAPEFRRLVRKALEREGSKAIRPTPEDAPKGVHVMLNIGRRLQLVSCHHWPGRKLGMERLAWVSGALKRHQEAQPIVAASGEFTVTAQAHARAHQIRLIDGLALGQMLADLPIAELHTNSPTVSPQSPPTPDAPSDATVEMPLPPPTRHLAGAWAALTLAIGFSAGMPKPAQAMSFVLSPPYLYMGGSVVREDWATWQDATQRFGRQVRVVVFHESAGGDALAARRIGLDLRERGLDTVVLGRCLSACANMFLAGVVRQFGQTPTSIPTELGFHGRYDRSTGAVNTRLSGDYFVKMTDGRMTEPFIALFTRINNPAGLMRFVHPAQRTSPTQPLVSLCSGDEDPQHGATRCEPLVGIDALDKGVVTHWATHDLPLPPAPTTLRVSEASWRAVPSLAEADSTEAPKKSD